LKDNSIKIKISNDEIKINQISNDEKKKFNKNLILKDDITKR
jgi:hypothetical protein